jgi:hypothetical protein
MIPRISMNRLCPAFDVQRSMLDVRCFTEPETSNIELRTPNIERKDSTS